MLMDSLVVTLHETGDVARIVAEGELDHPDADELVDAVRLALEAEPAGVVIDGARLTFVGSYGLASLLRAVEACRAAAIEPQMRLSRVARRLFEVSGVPLAPAADDLLTLGVNVGTQPDRPGRAAGAGEAA